MASSYMKLLIDKDMVKKDLRAMTGVIKKRNSKEVR